jgi:hypothetical protein
MYLYTPEKLRKELNANITACHMDIAPTLYDLSLSEVAYKAAGVSMLDEDKKHITFNNNGFIMCDDKTVSYNIETRKIIYFNFDVNSRELFRTNKISEHIYMPYP